MAKVFERLQYSTVAVGTTYVDDLGVGRSLRTRFVIPPGVSPAVAGTIANVTGAAIVTPTTPNAVCPDPGFKPRKLKFILANGGSLSVPIANRLTLVAARDAIIAALTGVGAAYTPICIQLIGEEQPSLQDELRPAGFTLAAGVGSQPGAGGKQYFYHGTMSYGSDGIFANRYFTPFKVATESVIANAAPALFSSALIAGGNNNVVPSANSSCPGSEPRTPRHYIVQSLIAAPIAGAKTEQVTKIPVSESAVNSINNVGVLLATITSTQCLSYKGEDNSRFHKV